MNPKQYKKLRESLGNQTEVGNALGLSRDTISNRERGNSPITKEAEYALKYLAGTGEFTYRQARKALDDAEKGLKALKKDVQSLEDMLH